MEQQTTIQPRAPKLTHQRHSGESDVHKKGPGKAATSDQSQRRLDPRHVHLLAIGPFFQPRDNIYAVPY